MIVIVAGMPRSGSTFAFNIVRDALCRRGSVYQEAPPPDILPELSKGGIADHILLKVHQLDENGILIARDARVICTIRKPEDAIASWIQTFGFSEEESISTMREWLRLYSHLKPFALSVPYGVIDKEPLSAARQIMRFVVPTATIFEIWRSARRHAKAKVKKRTDFLSRSNQNIKDIGFSWYDAKTFFHRRHVTSLKSQSAVERLPVDQVRRIRLAIAPDVANAGLDNFV